MRTTATVLALVCLTAAALGGCGDDQKSSAPDATAATAEAQPATPPPFGVGRPAPDFTLATFGGQPVTLSALRGKVVLVDFWATWCGPCRMTMPHFQELSRQFPDDLAVVAVSLDQEPAQAVPPYVERAGLTFTVTMDPRAIEVAQAWGQVRSIPTTYLVDAQGTVVKMWVGANPKSVYAEEIQRLIASS